MSDSSPTPARPMGFWGELDTEERSALRFAARPRVYPAGAVLMRQGDQSDHVIVIESGWAKISSSTESGHEVMLALRGPGDLVGEGPILGGDKERSATVTALASVRALVVPAGRFTTFLDEYPRAWRLVSGTIVRRLEDAERRAQDSAADGQRRLALLLIYLSELSEQHHPRNPDGSIEILPQLTQYELATWVDTARETVARALKTWRDHGLIHTGRRKITILDRPGLDAYARGKGRPRSAERP